MKSTIQAAIAMGLLLSQPVVAVPSPEIRGVVCEGDPCRSLSGLLVALYDSDDLLVDSTYTRNEGRFSLRTPDTKGHFYIVVTRTERAVRKDFYYDPARGRSLNEDVKLAAENLGPLGAINSLLDKLSAWLLLLAGALIGFLFRQFEEHLAARKKRAAFCKSVRKQIDLTLATFPKGLVNEKAQRLGEVVTAVEELARFLVARQDAEGAFEKLGKLQDFRALRETIRTVEEALATAGTGTAKDKADAIGSAAEKLRSAAKTLSG
jgi:hypothetical protein